tara:strand:- start:5870 stop:6364 length:495 start_codon:yes stop_codon:yes gene_type:complete
MTFLENYLKTPKVQQILTKKPGEEGFSLVELVVVIAVLAILSAVAIPAFVGVQANARASAVKNGLVNGVKECVVRAADNSTTNFADAQSFATAAAFRGFTVGQRAGTGNSCYGATATATNATSDSTFSIVMDATTGVVTRTCTNNSRAGCDLPTGGTAGGAGTW